MYFLSILYLNMTMNVKCAGDQDRATELLNPSK